MNPNAYYEIPVNKYIFNLAEKPEEKVRQWAIYELLSNFGVNINSIEIEVPVRVGTRTHRADIVVYDNSVPYIVIECKRREDKSHKKSLDQAISYASSKELNAKYAVATNGSYWKCARKINDEWVTISEIKNFRENDEKFLSIIEVEAMLTQFKGIAKNLFETIPSSDVSKFFYHLQSFYSINLTNKGIDHSLYSIADMLMRVIAHDAFFKDQGNYGLKKLKCALNDFIAYAKANHLDAIDSNYYVEALDQREIISIIHSNFLDLRKFDKLNTIDGSLCDMIISMSSYLLDIIVKHKEVLPHYPARGVEIIQDYINNVLKAYFFIKLPDRNENLDEFKIYFDIP
jgi:Holliday junction resolvase